MHLKFIFMHTLTRGKYCNGNTQHTIFPSHHFLMIVNPFSSSSMSSLCNSCPNLCIIFFGLANILQPSNPSFSCLRFTFLTRMRKYTVIGLVVLGYGQLYTKCHTSKCQITYGCSPLAGPLCDLLHEFSYLC